MAATPARQTLGCIVGLALAAMASRPVRAEVCPALSSALPSSSSQADCARPPAARGLRLDAECRVHVAVTYDGPAEPVVQRITRGGGRVSRVAPDLGSLIEAWVPAGDVDPLASSPGVVDVCLPRYARTTPVPGPARPR